MKFKNLVKFGIIVSTIIFSFSCTLPIEIVIPKENGVKISSTFKNLSGLSVDSKDNLYFVDNNVIKKLDSKNELTVIAGKEKPDVYPEDGVIDGDLNTAKFGNIRNPIYVEKYNSIYFVDIFFDKENQFKFRNISIRKISTNKTETILKFNIDEKGFINYKNSYINFDGIIFILDTSIQNNIKKIELYSKKIVYEIDINKVTVINPLDVLSDYESNIYLFEKNDSINSLYIKINEKWEKIIETRKKNIRFSIDKYNNLYILENTLEFNVDGEQISGFYSPILLHKIPKEKLLEGKLINLSDKKYIIGELNYDGLFQISQDGQKAYMINENSIYKINLKR